MADLLLIETLEDLSELIQLRRSEQTSDNETIDLSYCDLTPISKGASLTFETLAEFTKDIYKSSEGRYATRCHFNFEGSKVYYFLLNGIDFTGGCNFKGASFYSVSFTDCTFEKYMNDDQLLCSNIRVEKTFKLIDSRVKIPCDFRYARFEGKKVVVQFNKTRFGEEFKFENCTINDSEPNPFGFDLEFNETVFGGESVIELMSHDIRVSLKEAEVNSDFKIEDSVLAVLNCQLLKLNGQFIINCRAVMQGEHFSYDSCKIDELFFTKAQIVGDLYIEHVKIDKVDFTFSKIYESGKVRFLSSFISTILKCHDATIDGRFGMTGSKVKQLNASDTFVSGELDIRPVDKACAIENIDNRATARLLKHQALKHNNRIEALEYHAKEYELYERELFGKKSKSKYSIIRFCKDVAKLFTKGKRTDKFILFINRISNGYNAKPFRGIAFTLLSALLFYGLFLWVLKFENDITYTISAQNFGSNLGENVRDYLELLNIGNWKYQPFGLNYNWAYLVLVIARIVIGFGIYQIVQAFRKYGRW